MTIIIAGKAYVFAYPSEFVTLPDYSAHRGAVVTAVRELTPDENETEGPMWHIRANDGWEGHAWADELQEIQED